MKPLSTLIDVVLDTTGRKIQCSRDKGESSVYLPLEEAKKLPFFRFGNAYFIPAISIDIDNHKNTKLVGETIKKLGLPLPTVIVETTKGLHIHWFLDMIIPTKSFAALRLYQTIADALIKAFDSDKNAMPKQSGRMFRNPLLHKHTYFTDTLYTLDDFKHIIPKVEKSLETNTPRKKLQLRYSAPDFRKVDIGDRNTVLFDYGRHIAYSKGTVEGLDQLLTTAMEKANSMFVEPLTPSEVFKIVGSITRFMRTRYAKHTRNRRTIEFNRKLNEAKSKLKQNELVSKWAGLGIVSVKKLMNMSDRAGGRLFGISKNTFKKHKEMLLGVIKNLPLLAKKLTKITIEAPTNYTLPTYTPQFKPQEVHCTSPPIAA